MIKAFAARGGTIIFTHSSNDTGRWNPLLKALGAASAGKPENKTVSRFAHGGSTYDAFVDPEVKHPLVTTPNVFEGKLKYTLASGIWRAYPTNAKPPLKSLAGYVGDPVGSCFLVQEGVKGKSAVIHLRLSRLFHAKYGDAGDTIPLLENIHTYVSGREVKRGAK